MSKTKFFVGSRKSKLALTQTNYVISLLKEKYPNFEFEIKLHDTVGDKVLDVALSKIGDKGLFTKELETSIINHEIDFAVHSLKDLPTKLPEGLVVGGICKRDDMRDVVLMKKSLREKGFKTLSDLNNDSNKHIIGTSSLRRKAQILHSYPNLIIQDVRGNLDTRINKLENGDYSAIILAYAGLKRLGEDYINLVSQVLETDDMYVAVGQGALGVECRADDELVLSLLESITDHDTRIACLEERSLLSTLEGGCHVPIGVSTHVNNDQIHMFGKVLSEDGKICLTEEYKGPLLEEGVIGKLIADKLLQKGADKILKIKS